ncbi:MAG: cobalamin B12-binding domain-containing protein [Chloroflexi bacterium]|nr:cobalamin B12-binding domain-containing protein [Chloroflexota bacterium]
MNNRKTRVLVAKPGLDGHDLGAKLIARKLRDAGMEVIYTGLHQSPQDIVAAALQEDAQVIAVSILSGTHLVTARRLFEELSAQGVRDDVLVLFGGTIPVRDIPELKEIGVAGVFPTSSPPEKAIAFIRERISEVIGHD